MPDTPPTVEQFEKMTYAEREAYFKRVGLDERIEAAKASPDLDAIQPRSPTMTDTPRRLEPCPPDCDSTDEHSGHVRKSPTMPDTSITDDPDYFPNTDYERGYADGKAAHIDALTAAVEGLPAQRYTMTGLDTTTDSRMVNRAAVLAILRGEQ